jgi:FAD/FMN-containing dehydrogenase
MNPALLQQLTSIVGAAHVLASGDLSAYERDWRGRMQGKALCVVKPQSTDEVAQVVKACAAADAAIVPQGGNTSLVVGAVPDASGTQVVLSLQRMNRIRSLDPANLTLTAEAGCILHNIQQAATQAGLLFPLSLASEGTCTIGGNLGSNAGGTQVLRYGNARELCLGLEVVTADGEIWDGLSGLRKDNTGYDLRDLIIGSEGTLGIITAATLKLFPQPATSITALACCSDLTQCVALLGLAQSQLGAGLTGFEVMNQFSLALVRRHFDQLVQPLPPAPWTVLLEYASADDQAQAHTRFESLLETALGQGLIADAALAASLAQSAAMWHLREAIPLAQSEEGLNVKHDIALPVSAIPVFCQRTDAALAEAFPGIRLVNFGHLGDGNLHYNVQCPEGGVGLAFLEQHEETINAIVFDAVQACHGSFSAEHGIGALKRDALAERKSPVALGMMRAIKQALDPQGRLNPGRLL